MIVDQVGTVYLEGNGPLSRLFVPPDWFFFWNGNYGWSCSGLKQSSHQVPQNSAFEFLLQNTKIWDHPLNQPAPPLWSKTWLSWEIMNKFKPLSWSSSSCQQTLLVWGICQNEDPRHAVVVGLPHNPLKNLPHQRRLNFWLTVQTGISDPEMVFGFHSWCVFWYIRTPWSRLLRTRCWRRRWWICKNISRYTPANSQYLAVVAAWQSNPPGSRQGANDAGWLATSLCSSWKRIFLICVCGWHKIGWKETKDWSDVESTQLRNWFGRANIFPGSCILGMHSKKMWNKQRYCGQLQNHVRIENFRGWLVKLPFPQNLRISSWSYDMAGHAKKCVERYCELATQQLHKISTPCMLTITSKKKKQNLLENCQIHAFKLFWNAHTWHELDDLIFYGQ